jgi:hypothetical protein
MLSPMKSFLLLRPALRSSVLGLMACTASLLFAASAQAQTFEGTNSSSERIVIQMSGTGAAEVAWYPLRGGDVPKREIWRAAPDLGGFRLTAPPDSSLKKPGDSVTYKRISSKSTSVHCTAGCATTMPNLMGQRAR